MGLIYPTYTQAQATAVVQRIFPTGSIWDAAGVTALAEGLAGWFLRASHRVGQLALEALGSTATETILAWAREYGLLDDPSLVWPLALADQQALVLAAERAQGGQSASYYVGVAAGMGIAITIDDAPGGPPRWGGFIWGDGSAYASTDAAFEWLVTGPAATPAADRAQLEALFARLKPAHTIVTFSWTA